MQVRGVLSLEMGNHSSYCLLTRHLNTSNHPPKSSRGHQPPALCHSSWWAEGKSVRNVSQPREGGGFLRFPTSLLQAQLGWCWAPGQPNRGLTSPLDSTPAAGDSPHFFHNRLLGLGSMMAINKCWQRSAGFRLDTKMGGEEKAGHPATVHKSHATQRTS